MERFYPTDEQVKKLVADAISILETRDRKLFEKNANERSFSARLLHYLELQIEVRKWDEHWVVDCEYNRMLSRDGWDEAKTIDVLKKRHPEECEQTVEDTEARTVFPDIVVHARGTEHNLLVVELKKRRLGSNDAAVQYDRDVKLRSYLDQLGYRYAMFIRIDTDGCKCYCESI